MFGQSYRNFKNVAAINLTKERCSEILEFKEKIHHEISAVA
jgi:hypothetical protein